MKNILNKLNNSKHIVIIINDLDADSIGAGSAFYTYILQLHKKASLFCAYKDLDYRLKFIAWTDKLRDTIPSSAQVINMEDFILNNSKCEGVFESFKKANININKKMATSLYAGILERYNGFLSDDVNGTIFAMVKELIDYGADYKLCNQNIIKSISLAGLRLKAIMYKNMQLLHDARVAFFYVSNNDMIASGAMDKEYISALQEALYLKSVEVAVLIKEKSDLSIKCLYYFKDSIHIYKQEFQYSKKNIKNITEKILKEI